MLDYAEKGNSDHIPLLVAKKSPFPWPGPPYLPASSLPHVLECGSLHLRALPIPPSLCIPPKLCLPKSFTFPKPWVSPPRSFPLLPGGRHSSFAPRATITCCCASLVPWNCALLQGRGYNLINSISSNSAWPGKDAVNICAMLKGANPTYNIQRHRQENSLWTFKMTKYFL